MNNVPSIIEYAVNDDDIRNAVVYDEWCIVNNKLENQLSHVVRINNRVGCNEILEAIESINVQDISDIMHTEMEDWFTRVFRAGRIVREEYDIGYCLLVFDRLIVDRDCKVKISEHDITIKYDNLEFTIHSDNGVDINNIYHHYCENILEQIKGSVDSCSGKQLRKIQKIIND